MLKLVAKYADAYNTVWHPDPSVAIERFRTLEAACREVGRDPSEIRRTAGTTVLAPNAGEVPDLAPTVMTGSVQELAEKLWAFHTEAGVTHMTLILDPWTTGGIEAFGKVIEAIRSFE
jgi:alkanesulfonate monooxygenase SsuD/methylene tetrahydromethanopterin reductase-like flavin-dependent oxidoreductase (luciferase family)